MRTNEVHAPLWLMKAPSRYACNTSTFSEQVEDAERGCMCRLAYKRRAEATGIAVKNSTKVTSRLAYYAENGVVRVFIYPTTQTSTTSYDNVKFHLSTNVACHSPLARKLH